MTDIHKLKNLEKQSLVPKLESEKFMEHLCTS